MEGRLVSQEAADMLAFSPDPPRLAGWVVPDPEAPDVPPEIGLDLEGFGSVVVRSGPARDAAGRFAVIWPLPPALCDGRTLHLRAFDMGSGRELSDSPLGVFVPAQPGAEAGGGPAAWPLGLAGEIGAAAITTLAEGLCVTAQLPATKLRFEVATRMARDSAPRHGVRVMANAATPRLALYFRLPDPVPGEEVLWEIPAWLPEATEAQMQSRIEISLAARGEDGFVVLRRLLRGRVFRRPQLHEVALRLTPEETGQLAEGGTWLAVEAFSARGLAALMPEVAAAATPAAGGFEDSRLAASFAQAEAFARTHAMAPPLPAAPRRGTAEAHPFTQVILPVHNGHAEVKACLESLRRSAGGPMQVVIVDDGSGALTADMLRAEAALDPRLVLHRRDINRGYTKSINEAVRMTGADWVVVLNSDTIVPPDWLARLHAAARAAPGTGMVGPLSNAATWQSIPEAKRPDGGWSTNDVLEPRHLPRVQAFLDRVSERAYPEFPILNGFCTLIARAVFDQVGLYDEEAFPMGYGEETDLCLRARQAGFRLTLADDAFVHHHKSVSFGGAARSRLTRAGGLEMTNKHLGISVSALERAMQDCPPLRRLRARCGELLAELD